jgi:hypothetical protein
VVCAVISAGAVAVGCGDDEGGNPYDLEMKGTKVEVTPIYQACETDADCTLMDITCDVCCVQDAITTSLADIFDNERMIACQEYDGPVCSCIPKPVTTRCDQGTCITVPIEPGS